jgi:hypothetical protein
VDLAALKAGLVLCGDVTISLECLDVVLKSRDNEHDEIRDALIHFAVSDAHQEIRQHLGLAVQD